MGTTHLSRCVLVVADVTAEYVRSLLGDVVDPEIPVVTIDDLGILRDVQVDGGRVTVVITPTYSGCPAMDVIRDEIDGVLRLAGFDDITVKTVLSPAWTTDWMSDAGRQKLADFGIAAPRRSDVEVVCPRCSGGATVISEFGSTACKALMVCSSCGEPFDHFKEI